MIRNMEKQYLDDEKQLYIIEDFLTKEELLWFKERIDDPKDWYKTMRSPYGNILNKFLDAVPSYDENGNVKIPDENSTILDLPIFSSDDGIWKRLESILPKGYRRHATLQTFKFVTDEEINSNLNTYLIEKGITSVDQVDFAMDWHDDEHPQVKILAAFSLYLNDDFEGGELEFKNLDLKIKPKSGMLVVIPMGEKYTHRVNKVLGPNSRHTLYGNSFVDPLIIPVSTAENC